ncbi:MAG: EpsI family protein [Bacteroidales bacterium]|nr:EpsI family protein [Bacteroidales bacterium]
MVITSIFIYSKPSSITVEKNISLKQALANIHGWENNGFSPFDQKIVDALELDDYANQSYTKRQDIVSLYIGYYLTTKKVGAAHDPLVCFPGQGWSLSDKKAGELILTDSSLSYSSMIVQRGQQKELVIYWFQSYDQANPDTLSQKISSLWGKIINNREDNAFVRITIPIGEKSISESQETIFKFIQDFYPVFLKYVKS